MSSLRERAPAGKTRRNPGTVKRAIELLVFALAAPVTGSLLFPHDPLGLQAGFPWAIVGPVIFAARYGVAHGAVCAVVAAAAILFTAALFYGSLVAAIVLSAGMVVLSVVVGDAGSEWRKRAAQAGAENQYLRHRLKEFSNDYHVLKVSHGQLEEYMAGQRLSLRQALQQLKPVLTAEENGLQAGSELMAVFSQFCSVQIAGLYAMKNDKIVDSRAVAIHGNMGELPMFDKILNLAIKEQKLVSVKLDSLAEDKHQNDLLAAVPIVDAGGKLHGVLAIRDMHFMAFQQENLNLLSLLCGYVGDMLTRSKGASNTRGAWFMAELETALRFASTNSVRSSLLCIRLKRFDADRQISDHIASGIRSLDASWQLQSRDGFQTVVVLLPLISKSQAEGYLQRLIDSITAQFGIDFEKATSSCRMLELTKSVSRDDCVNFIRGTEQSKKAKRGKRVVGSRLSAERSEPQEHDSGDEKVA